MSQFSQRAKEKQVEGNLDRYQIRYRCHVAQTGTCYYSCTAPDGEELTVRVADHADAYCTADLTIDPAINQIDSFLAWVKKHGEKKAREATVFYAWLTNDGFIVGETTRKSEALASNPGNAVLHTMKRGSFTGWIPAI